MTRPRNIYSNQEMLFEQISQNKQHIIPKLTSMLLEVHRLNQLTPLFDLIREVSSATAVHSKGVAAVAQTLGDKAGLNEGQTTLLALSGVLHDVGKIAVPDHILNKAGPLSENEAQEMQSHVELTISILSTIPLHSSIIRWCALHHERLNGKGYPFGLDRSVLDEGSRIMSIADVFVALTEDRIYRKGMAPQDAVSVIEHMVGDLELDPRLFALLKSNPNLYNDKRLVVQHAATNTFQAAS